MNRLIWRIGGPQGSGVDTAANIFSDAIALAGYYIYGNREYYSNIKGRHSYFTVAIEDRPVLSVSDSIDILATFEPETVFQHFKDVRGVALYDKNVEGAKLDSMLFMEGETRKRAQELLAKHSYPETVKGAIDYMAGRGVDCIPVDYDAVLRRILSEVKLPPTIVDRSKNVIAVAASYGLLGLDKRYMIDALTSIFKKEEYVKLNTKAVEYGMQLVQPRYGMTGLEPQGHRLRVDGNSMSALGKLLAGLRLQTYYPITPASDESTYIEANQMLEVEGEGHQLKKYGVVVLQSEDEISAVNTAIGATLTGARAATATSGPGFCLMAEGIGWAGINEVPLVITYYMRGSPSTGLPTRSGQADLKFALNVSHGEFPRVVIASGDHPEVFHDAFWAMNLAEIYQTPVVHLVEKVLANSYSVIDDNELSYHTLRIDRGKLSKGGEGYKRFAITDDGVSPRAFMGSSKLIYTGDEHNEVGHITEDVDMRFVMFEKRMKKMETMARQIPDAEKLKTYGDIEHSDAVVLTWGSPKQATIEAIDMLAQEGIQLGMVQLRMFSPFPREAVRRLLGGKKMIIDVENNYTAQGAQVVTEQTGIEPTNYVLKWNGRIMTREEVYDALRRAAKGGTKRVALNGGV